MYRDSDRFKWDCGLGQTNLENLNKIMVQITKNYELIKNKYEIL